ncbi:DUF3742 family protein [Salmonella enterica subsp. enterica serovar Worthington]|uniref:DUF3742 family protein n=1 Tax=Salmonella enterica TaxID=28901 RepID=UPI000F9E8978|nr:DUF3742 family protein [Salmonella enterica]ECF3886042.1 DUF3742 family protein [Salmonella enterica subsp. enterica serovar Ank]EGI5054084.1 DUF3742 family protein [Salmonella enterica subsp. enterica serovar Worthington]QGR31471.1 DUF3742 family protein [Salmonella enterica]
MNAQARGARAARLYQRAKSKLISLDQFCVQKAREHKLPAWTGHLPVTVLTGILIAAVIFGSMLFVSISLLIFALILLSSAYSKNQGASTIFAEEENDDEEDGIRYGHQGTGYYMGGNRVDEDD